MERRLAAILSIDVVGYSRLMGADEPGTLATIKTHRRELIDPKTAEHHGRIVKLMGDGALMEFASVVDAVAFAVEVQCAIRERYADSPGVQQIRYRIGINIGDVIVEGDDIYGDGVNVAARLEGLAEPGGICIARNVFNQVKDKLDLTFEDLGEKDVKNIAEPLRAYRVILDDKANAFVTPVVRPAAISRRWFFAAGAAGVAVLVMAAVLVSMLAFDDKGTSTPSGPRIAVIPFGDLGGNPDDAFFSDGLTKDISAHLSKFSNLFVIAPSSTAAFRDNADCAEIRRELQADYILEGTIRRSRDHLRVTTTFTDAATCRQLDSPGPFDRNLTAANVLDVQLEIAKKVVAEIGSSDAPLTNARVQEEIRHKAPGNILAYDCVLLSYWFYETFAPDRHRKARDCLERAVEIDPTYSLAWSRLAFSYIEAKKYAIDTPSDWAELSRAAADRAIDLDPDNPDAYYALAILSQITGEDRVVFRNFAERAIELNPNDAFVLADLGTWMAYSGAWEKGKEWVTRAKLLNPKHQSWLDYIWHLHHYLKGEYEEARDVALRVNLPNNYMVQASLTAAYAMNGEQEKANQTLVHLLEIRPDYPGDPRAPFRTRGMPTELVEGLMEGLRKAGLDVPPASVAE